MLQIALKAAAAALNVAVRYVFMHCFVCTTEVLMYPFVTALTALFLSSQSGFRFMPLLVAL